MNPEWMEEQFVEQLITYTLLKDDTFYIIEHVPARVNLITGEQLFSPQTVAHIQQIITGPQRPQRIIQAPVYEFA
jgi:hypothetical protein